MATDDLRFLKGFLSQISELPNIYSSNYVSYDSSVPECQSSRLPIEYYGNSGSLSQSNSSSGSLVGNENCPTSRESITLCFKATKSGAAAEFAVNTSDTFAVIRQELCQKWQIDPNSFTIKFLHKGKSLLETKCPYNYREIMNRASITVIVSPAAKKKDKPASDGPSTPINSGEKTANRVSVEQQLSRKKEFWSDIRNVVAKHVSSLPPDTQATPETTVTKIVNSFTHSLLSS